MADGQQLLNIIKIKGPVIPINLVKEVGLDTMFIGAMLSDLVSKGQLIISALKVGGSPLYYIKEHAYKLQDFAKYLNEKDKRTFDLLKEKKVLRDVDQTPLVRVSLTMIRDFAVPLDVTHDASQERFWRWYLLSNEDAERIIKSMLGKTQKQDAPEEKPQTADTSNSQTQVPPSQKAAQEKTKTEEILKATPSKPPQETEAAPEKETQKTQKQETQTPPSFIKPTSQEKKQQPQTQIPQQIQNDALFSDTLFKQFKKSADQKGIIIHEGEIFKKQSEIGCIISVPSALGMLRYYAYLSSKKRINDTDLNTAFVKGNLKKLTTAFFTGGELTKKAEEMLKTSLGNSVIMQEL